MKFTIVSICILLVLLTSCNNEKNASTGIETSTISLQVVRADGTPAARARVLIFSEIQNIPQVRDTLQLDTLGRAQFKIHADEMLQIESGQESIALPCSSLSQEKPIQTSALYEVPLSGSPLRIRAKGSLWKSETTAAGQRFAGIPMGHWTLVDSIGTIQGQLYLQDTIAILDESTHYTIQGSTALTPCGPIQGYLSDRIADWCFQSKEYQQGSNAIQYQETSDTLIQIQVQVSDSIGSYAAIAIRQLQSRQVDASAYSQLSLDLECEPAVVLQLDWLQADPVLDGNYHFFVQEIACGTRAWIEIPLSQLQWMHYGFPTETNLDATLFYGMDLNFGTGSQSLVKIRSLRWE